jgi:hypothetical protein
MLSAGSTATGRGSALITAAAAAQPGGYCTATTLPPTPHAKSGSVATNARLHTVAVAKSGSQRRSVTTAAAAASV